LIPVENIDRVPIFLQVGKDDDLATTADAHWIRDTIWGIKKYNELDGFHHGSFTSISEDHRWFLSEVIDNI
jgi:hypothetical protein